MARVCKKCHTVENNMAVFRCRVCNEVLPLECVDDKKENSSSGKWYIRCGSCGTWISFNDKNNIPNSCPECYEIGINNIGEDSILSEDEYLAEIGEIKKEDNEVHRDAEQLSSEKGEQVDLKTNNEKIEFLEFINKQDGKVIKMKQGEYILGKEGDIESEYFDTKRFISREHIKVFIEDKGVFIQDWNSTNRTRINGEFIYKNQGKMRIVNRDIITMADQSFEVRIC